MSVEQGSSLSPVPVRKLTSNVLELRQCRANGGCRVDCSHERTDDSRLPWDTDAYGGWGGHSHHGTPPGAGRPPVVFVHGNQRDACDYEAHADFFLNRSYAGDELWAITFGSASPSHDEMADQLDSFVANVREHTGASQVAVVGHSLGVTGTRYWLHREDRFDWVDSVVGLAGANHGTVLNSLAVKTGLVHGTYKVSRFLRDDYQRLSDHPLSELNADETPGDVDYYTVRGTNDPLFWNCPESPALEGATNVAIEADHDGVRASLTTVELLYEWLADEKPYDVRILAGADRGSKAS